MCLAIVLPPSESDRLLIQVIRKTTLVFMLSPFLEVFPTLYNHRHRAAALDTVRNPEVDLRRACNFPVPSECVGTVATVAISVAISCHGRDNPVG